VNPILIHLQLIDWLRAKDNISDIRPVTVTIGAQTWQGAEYTRTMEYSADMMAVIDGRADGLDWYVAAYYQKDPVEVQFAQFQPFGPNFLLAPWDVPDTKIDTYEPKPYIREELKLKY